MTTAPCPRCGEPAAGNFCASCGAPLTRDPCAACGEPRSPGDRFCTRCGTPLAPVAAGGNRAGGPGGAGGVSGNVGWWAAGLLLVALILFAAHPVYAPGDGEPEPGPAPATTPAAPGPAPDVDLSSMTPREAADRLFDRVMRAASAGDSVEVRNFLPMAIGAYDRARPLDADGLFHLSLLYRTGLQPEPALAAAREGLADDPDHLLLLSAASEAALAQGDTTRARSLAEHLLDVYEAQVERGLEEYRVHATLLPRIRDDAEALAEGSGPP